jgi:hypothetical protein
MDKLIQNKKFILFLIISTLISFVLLIFLRVSNVYSGADYGVDVYYHIKAGDMFPFFATTKVFPWTEMSIWKTHFYDKELGFHLIIYILRHIGSFLGISSQAPFNFVNLCFSGFILCMFSVWGYFKCRKSAFILAPLLVFISPVFLQKLIILRPALISIVLFSLTLFILISNSTFKRKLFYIFIMGWLYSICYSVPHVILLPLFVYFISRLFTKDIKSNIKYLLFPCFGVIGIIVGLTIHPQFPNTYLNWYIQGFQVVLKMFGLSSSEVGLGSGMLAPSAVAIKQNMLVFILLFINIVLFWSSRIKDEKKIFLILLQLVVIAGYFFSKRFIEYAVPVEVICFALLTSCEYKDKNEHIILMFYSKTKTLLIGGILLIFVMLPINNSVLKKILIIPPCYQFGEWQKDNLPKGTYIGLLNWGDFPRLFYTAPELKYSMALDPMFSYYVYPERTNIIEQFRLGYNQRLTPAELKKALGTNLVYAPKFYQTAVMYLLEKGAHVVYYDKDGCLLKLTDTTTNNLMLKRVL